MSNDLDAILGVRNAEKHPEVSGETRWSNQLKKRYTDAYRVARFVVGLGTAVKIIGFICGGIGILGGFAVISESRGMFSGAEGAPLGVAVVLFSALIAFSFFVVGVIISSMGQMQKATVDSAVNNSPMLTNEERAEIMSLN